MTIETNRKYMHADGTPCDIPWKDTSTADGREACMMPEGRRPIPDGAKCNDCGRNFSDHDWQGGCP